MLRDLLSNTPNCYVHAGEFRGYYLRGMHNRSTRSGTELAREIQLTNWLTAGNLSNRSSGVQIPRDICTRFGRYLYSTKCSWIIMYFTVYSSFSSEGMQVTPLFSPIRTTVTNTGPQTTLLNTSTSLSILFRKTEIFLISLSEISRSKI